MARASLARLTPMVLDLLATRWKFAPLAVLLLSTPVHAEPASSPHDAHASVGSYTHQAVASDHPAASEAGAEILRDGGNAADAAAAVLLALGVVSPASSGLGGGGFLTYYRAADALVSFLDFRERAPRRATRHMFLRASVAGALPSTPPVDAGPASSASQVGGMAVGIPGEPAGIDAMLRMFGSMSTAQITAPAIRLAREGVPVTAYVAELAAPFRDQMRGDPVFDRWFTDTDGLREGAVLTRSELLPVLEMFARHGAAAFYRGHFSDKLAADIVAHGGIATPEDFSDYRVRVREPLRIDALGFRWFTAPPPSAGGFTLLQSLQFLDSLSNPTTKHESSAITALDLHNWVESWKGPFLDRERYFGDPDQILLPVDKLLTPARAAARAQTQRDGRAHEQRDYDLPVEPVQMNAVQSGGAGTSHVCVVDKAGNVASVTTTINLPFGARFTSQGIVMNDQMDDFAREVGVANAFGLTGGARNLPGPWKRPVSTMSPTIVLRDGRPVLCIGAAGGSRIVTSTEQVALRVLVHGESLATAIAAPRVHAQGSPNVVYYEEATPIAQRVVDELRLKGHVVEARGNVGVVQAIQIEAGALHAASDPRKGGRPAGD